MSRVSPRNRTINYGVSSRRGGVNVGAWIANLIIIAVIGAVMLSYPAIMWASVRTVEFTVENRERVVSRNARDATYMVWVGYPEGGTEVFKNVDAWAFLKFNSSDVYGRLKPNAVCVAKVAGWRVSLFSWYRNIISAECR